MKCISHSIVLITGLILNGLLHACYDSNIADAVSDWPYRVPVTISSGSSINSTIKNDDHSLISTVFSWIISNANANGAQNNEVQRNTQAATLGAAETLLPVLSLKKTSSVISDGVSVSNPKRIPGATIEYILTAVNSGAGSAGADTIVINDTIPENTSYIINSLAFVDGRPSSGLNTTPVAPSASILQFSTDGVNFDTVQSTAVTHIRVHPSGEFHAATEAGNPSFQVLFRVKVD